MNTEVTPPWMRVALGELGQRELPGHNQNARIVAYHQATTLKATEDEVPWCSSFVCWCLDQAGLPSTRSAAAASYNVWGRPVAAPARGVVLVFTRQGGNHVGFYAGEDETHFLVLGGNQGDAVSLARYPKSRLTGMRWPANAAFPSGLVDPPVAVVAPAPAPAKRPWWRLWR